MVSMGARPGENCLGGMGAGGRWPAAELVAPDNQGHNKVAPTICDDDDEELLSILQPQEAVDQLTTTASTIFG